MTRVATAVLQLPISVNIPESILACRGRCSQMSMAMAPAFPELVRRRKIPGKTRPRPIPRNGDDRMTGLSKVVEQTHLPAR